MALPALSRRLAPALILVVRAFVIGKKRFLRRRFGGVFNELPFKFPSIFHPFGFRGSFEESVSLPRNGSLSLNPFGFRGSFELLVIDLGMKKMNLNPFEIRVSVERSDG